MRWSLAGACVAVLCVAGCDDTLFSSGEGGGSIEGEGFCAVKEVFASDCLSCHSAAAKLGDLDLETDPYGTLVEATSVSYGPAVLVTPGDASGSLLYHKMMGSQGANEGGVMPPGGALDEATLKVVEAWINGGAADCEGGTTSVVGYHPSGWSSPSVHGTAAKLQTEADCRGCHGDDLLGGTVGVACESCHGAGWEANCTFCHGGEENTTGAPPEGIRDELDPSELNFTAHNAHVTKTNHKGFPCSTCHVYPESALVSGHLFDDDTPGQAENDFTAGLSPEASWDGAGTCSNVYCHGDGMTNGSMVDGAGPLDCEGCHAATGSGSAGWATMSGPHADHMATGTITCADCHASVVDSDEHLTGVVRHVDGILQVEIAQTGFTYTPGFITCNGSCHGSTHTERSW